MDQNRLLLAIVISVSILVGFEFLMPHQATRQTLTTAPLSAVNPIASTDTDVTANTPRLPIFGDRVQGSLSLIGAKFDDLLLRDYHETVNPKSPLVRVLDQDGSAQSNYLQFGWVSDTPGIIVPDNKTLWNATSATLTSSTPVTLTWENGHGLTFEITIALDSNYLFSVDQIVRNDGTGAVALRPWSRVRRGYTPPATGSYGGQQGLLGAFGNQLHEMNYKDVKSAAEKDEGTGYQFDGTGGWAGITDKYWLTAIIPDQATAGTTRFRMLNLRSGDGWQVDFAASSPESIAPRSQANLHSSAFVGAKEVKLLDSYEAKDNIPSFDKAVDFGWFYFISKPIFYALDFLNSKIGNFGIAIMVFTVGVKLLFFPLANRSYRSMNKMRLLAPRMQELRTRYKEDPAKMNSETMALYKNEGVNPASGCLPMIVQIPVFWALYRDLNTSIEMRHAPFFGWVHDLSAQDPTNLFNLFGLLPFDPTIYVSAAHLGVWPLIMGATMYLQQRLNPPVPDPVQARMMQFMPLIFTFMMGRASAGLVIYWSWNNLLSLGQQWIITRQSPKTTLRLAKS